MISVWKRGCFAYKVQTFKAFTGLLSHRSDNGDYENPLSSNKSGSSKASTKLFQAPLSLLISKDPSANWYSQ